MSITQVLVITGAQDWEDAETIKYALYPFRGRHTLVLHGGTKGADTIAARVARELGCTIIEKIPDRVKYGREAGTKRNQEMLLLAQGYAYSKIPTVILAFHTSVETSQGTKAFLKQAKSYRLPVMVVGK